jgi:hypothetical protein
MLLLAAIVFTAVWLARIVGDSGADARITGAVGNTESTPLDGRFVLIDWKIQHQTSESQVVGGRTPELVLDGTDAVADATESEVVRGDAALSKAIRLMAVPREAYVVKGMAVDC